MKRFPLVQVGNPTFRDVSSLFKPTEIVSAETDRLIKRMVYTMREIHGVGLAAPQIGLQRQLFVIRQEPTKFRADLVKIRPYTVFNPVILKRSKDLISDWEGCFSVAEAGFFALVKRAESIQVRYLDHRARTVERIIGGFEARVFMHEYDHLRGKVFLDQAVDLSTIMSADEYRAMRVRVMNN